jgi:uncharacterized protein (TIRG00374 family)
MFRSFQRSDDQVSVARRVFSLPTLISLAVAAAFLVFLVVRFDVDLSTTWQQVKNSNPWLLLLALVVHYTIFVFRGARWRLLLHNVQGKGKSGPGVLYCSELTLLGWFANSVTWFRLGDAYRAYLYHSEQRASFPRTVGTILSERVLDTAVLAVLLLIAVAFLIGQHTGPSWTVVVTALVLLAALGMALLVIARFPDKLLRWLPGWLAERYQAFCEGVLGSFRRIPLVTLLGVLGWLSEIGRLYLVTLALGIHLSFPFIVFITLANSLLTLVPTPGGVGAVEPGVAGLLVQLAALSTSAAAALVLVDRSISYLSIIVSGAALFLARQAYRKRGLASASPTVVDTQ